MATQNQKPGLPNPYAQLPNPYALAQSDGAAASTPADEQARLDEKKSTAKLFHQPHLIRRPQAKVNTTLKKPTAPRPQVAPPAPEVKAADARVAQEQRGLDYYKSTADDDAAILEARAEAQREERNRKKEERKFKKMFGNWNPHQEYKMRYPTNLGAYSAIGAYQDKLDDFVGMIRIARRQAARNSSEDYVPRRESSRSASNSPDAAPNPLFAPRLDEPATSSPMPSSTTAPVGQTADEAYENRLRLAEQRAEQTAAEPRRSPQPDSHPPAPPSNPMFAPPSYAEATAPPAKAPDVQPAERPAQGVGLSAGWQTFNSAVGVPRIAVAPSVRVAGHYAHAYPGHWWYHDEPMYQALDANQQRVVDNVGRIMETELGQQLVGEHMCTQCAQNGEECWAYTQEARRVVRFAGSACARCRFERRGCSQSERKTPDVQPAEKPSKPRLQPIRPRIDIAEQIRKAKELAAAAAAARPPPPPPPPVVEAPQAQEATPPPPPPPPAYSATISAPPVHYSATISAPPVHYARPPADQKDDNEVQERPAKKQKTKEPPKPTKAELMMAKMGYVKGKGLGKNSDGVTTHLEVKARKDPGGRQVREDFGDGSSGNVKSAQVFDITGGLRTSKPDHGPFGEPSRVIVAWGCIDGVDLESDAERDDGGIRQEIGDMFNSKFGNILRIHIDLENDSRPVYIQFQDPLCALNAVNRFHEGYEFQGRRIVAKFYDELKFNNLVYEH